MKLTNKLHLTMVEGLRNLYSSDQLKLIDKKLKKDHTNILLRLCRSEINLSVGENEKSLIDSNFILNNIDPNCVPALLLKGDALDNIGKHEKAMNEFDKVILLGEEKFVFAAKNNKSLALQKLNKHEEAIGLLNEIIEINPEYEPAYLNRGVSYLVMKKYGDAELDFNFCIQQNNKDGIAYFHRGTLYTITEKYDKAESDLKKSIKLIGDADCYFGYGSLLCEKKRISRSDRSF